MMTWASAPVSERVRRSAIASPERPPSPTGRKSTSYTSHLHLACLAPGTPAVAGLRMASQTVPRGATKFDALVDHAELARRGIDRDQERASHVTRGHDRLP